MKIDTDDYLTFEEAKAVIGCSLRSLYRAIDAAEADGKEVTTVIFGKRLVVRKMIEQVKERTYPFGTDRRHKLALACGFKGGTQKAANAARRSRRKSGG